MQSHLVYSFVMIQQRIAEYGFCPSHCPDATAPMHFHVKQSLSPQIAQSRDRERWAQLQGWVVLVSQWQFSEKEDDQGPTLTADNRNLDWVPAATPVECGQLHLIFLAFLVVNYCFGTLRQSDNWPISVSTRQIQPQEQRKRLCVEEEDWNG